MSDLDDLLGRNIGANDTVEPQKFWIGKDKPVVERHVILSPWEALDENGDHMIDGSDEQPWEEKE